MTIADIVAAAGPGRFADWLGFELKWEAAFGPDGVTIVNEDVSGDGGGLTFAGVDQASHPHFPYNNPAPSDVCLAYRMDWDAVQADSLPLPVGETVANFGVNRGDDTAARMLQGALGVTADGDIGPITLGAANGVQNPLKLALEIVSIADGQYQGLADRAARYQQFLQGWLNRDADLITFDQTEEAAVV